MSPFARVAQCVIILQNHANFCLIKASLSRVRRRDSDRKGMGYINISPPLPL